MDSEHIFGFTEGADIGDKGESELESITIGRLGKQGDFAVLTNETSYRYGVEQSFRASVGIVTDYYSVHDTPGYLDRTGLRQSGLTSEFRWQFSEHDSAPIGLTLSLAPTWRRVNDPTPGQGQAYTLPVSLLADHMFIPNQLYAAVNVTVAPTFSSVAGLWQSTQPFELSAALAGALGDRIFLGGEVRWAAQKPDRAVRRPRPLYWSKSLRKAPGEPDRQGGVVRASSPNCLPAAWISRTTSATSSSCNSLTAFERSAHPRVCSFSQACHCSCVP